MNRRTQQRYSKALCVCLILLLCSTLMPFSSVSADSAEYSYAVTANKDTVGANEVVNFSLTISIQKYAEDLYDAVFVIQVREDVFDFNSNNNITIYNPGIGTSGIKIFAQDYLTRDTNYDDQGYIGYTIRLNGSDEAKALFERENLVSVACVFSLTFEKVLTEEGETEIIRYGEKDDGVYIPIEITIDPEKNPDPQTVHVYKNINAVYRLVDDSVGGNDGNLALYEKRPHTIGDAQLVEPGDLVIFSIELMNSDPFNALEIASIVDNLPGGYEYVDIKTAPDIYLDSNSNCKKISDLKPNGAEEPNWVWTSGAYVHTFDPVLELSKYEQGKTGHKYNTYLVARVVDDPVANRVNSITVNQENGGTGSGSNSEPIYLDGYDLALTTHYSHGFNADCELIANYFSNIRPTVVENNYVAVTYTIINQGNKAQNPEIHAYVPAGLEVVDSAVKFGGVNYNLSQEDNSIWTKVETTYTKNDITGVWSDLSLYKTSIDKVLNTGDKVEVYLFLKVVGNNDTGGLTATDFYVAGEISAFETEEGEEGVDADSTPDNNPVNDLISNIKGDDTVHPIDSNMNHYKEKSSVVDERAKLIEDKLQDEDDFDFASLNARKNQPTDEMYDVLSKQRVAYEKIKTKADVAALFDDYEYIMPYLFNTLKGEALPDDGVVTSHNTFMLYEIWINQDGLLDTEGFTFTDELPKGLKFLSVPRVSLSEVDAIRIYKVLPTQRVENEDGKWVISHKPGFCTEFDVLFDENDDDGNLNTDYKKKSRVPSIDAKDIGLVGDVSEDGRTLTIQFNTPKQSDNKVLTDTTGAYKIQAIVILDKENLDYGTMRNSAELMKEEETFTVTETVGVHYDAGGGLSFIQKYARMNESDTFVSSPDVVVAQPDANGDVIITYQLRFRSEYSFDQNTINVSDVIPVEIFDSFVGAPDVAGFNYTIEDGELKYGDAIGESDLAITAATNANSLTVSNPDLETKAGEIYHITFQVKYKNWQYGQLIRNSIGSINTFASIPLQIQVEKADEDTQAPLAGYEFKAYYADTSQKADLSNPVLDLQESPVVFDEATGAVEFLPAGFAPDKAGSWDIVLVETIAPVGYESNLNKEFLLRVTSDNKGNLRWEDDSSNTGYVMTFTVGNQSAAATLYNQSEPIKDASFVLKKIDADTGAALSGAQFVLTDVNSGQSQTVTTGANGTVAIPVSGQNLPAQYTLQEMKAPEGYILSAERATFTVDTDGCITELTGEKKDYQIASNSLGIVVKNSRIPTNKPDTPAPQTGDNISVMFWLGCIALSALGFGVLVAKRRKKRA